MPTIKSLNDLLDNLDPFMKFALPLKAMKKAGFAYCTTAVDRLQQIF